MNYFIDTNQAHNILIADEGMTVYIIPRKFDMLIDNLNYFTSFETLCGFAKCKNEQAYTTITDHEFGNKLRQQVSLDEAAFEEIKEALTQKFL